MELRLLAKHNPDNHIRIAASGVVRPLVALLSHANLLLQEHGVMALLNLSICNENKAIVVEAGAIWSLVRELKSAASPAAMEDAACLLWCLVLIKHCSRSSFSLSSSSSTAPSPPQSAARAPSRCWCPSTRAAGRRGRRMPPRRSTRSAAVRARTAYVCPLLDLESGMVDKAAYVLHSLMGFAEGRSATVEEGDIPVLVEMVEVGTSQQKEITTLSLLQIYDDNAAYRTMVAREGAIPPLAEALIEMLRQPRSGSLRATKPAAIVAAE
ncbi:hypothetical protein VPH35_111500 [Triticum aestivum]